MLMQTLQIEVAPIAEPRGRILHLDGPLVISNLQAFRAALRRDYALLTILDLSAVPHMDSTGLGEIINFYTLCQRGGGKLILAAPAPRVADLLHMTRIDTLLTIAPTLEAALA